MLLIIGMIEGVFGQLDEIKKFLQKLLTQKNHYFPPRGLGQRRSGSQLQFVISGDTYENINKNMQKLF